MVGMEEVFPHARAFDDPMEMEEERRLCYVGVTRAKKRVYLVRAARRTFLGSTNSNPPSRFLADIPPNLVMRSSGRAETKPVWTASVWNSWNSGSDRVAEHPSAVLAAPPAVKLDLKPGDHVRHEKFGDGVVVNASPLTNDYQVTVAFQGVGVKKLILTYARLEKIG